MNVNQKVAANFTLGEFLQSHTALRVGIDNTPPPYALMNLCSALAPFMQKVRDLLGHPVLISSGYRSPELNALVRGSPGSAHVHGLAADFTCPGFGTPFEICRFLSDHVADLRFDQLIYEGTWVHISAAAPPRLEVLSISYSLRGGTLTRRGLHE